MTSHKLTERQTDLLNCVVETGRINTHKLAQHCGHLQAYETTLRDRLFRLEVRGLLKSENTTRGRFWTAK